MKKLLLGLGSIAAIAAPVVLVVSCGDKKEARHFNVTYDEAKPNELVIVGSGITIVSPVDDQAKFTMRASNSGEIVQRIIGLGFDKYKEITVVKLSIEGFNIDGSSEKTITIVTDLKNKLDDDKIKTLSAEFETLVLTSK